MSSYYSTTVTESFIETDDGWFRASRAESVAPVKGAAPSYTSKGEPLYPITITLIGGATFRHRVKDVPAFVRKVLNA